MRTYSTTILEKMDPASTIGLSAAANVTGLNIAEMSRVVKSGQIGTRPVPGKRKPELVVGDVIELIRLKNSRSHLAKIRAMNKSKAPVILSPSTSRVVVGVFEEAASHAPHGVIIPPNADTVGDLIAVGRAAYTIAKSTAKKSAVNEWITYLERL